MCSTLMFQVMNITNIGYEEKKEKSAFEETLERTLERTFETPHWEKGLWMPQKLRFKN